MLFELSNSTIEENANGLKELFEICLRTLNHHVPAKQKFARGHLTHRTKFCNEYLRNKTGGNKRKYTKQRNYCQRERVKSKREYFSDLDVKITTDNKTFWKTAKPFLSDKVTTSSQKITLIENNKIVKNDNDTARVLNTFFSNIVCDLKIPDYNNCDSLAENIQEPVLKAIVKYRNHPSILTIEEVF